MSYEFESRLYACEFDALFDVPEWTPKYRNRRGGGADSVIRGKEGDGEEEDEKDEVKDEEEVAPFPLNHCSIIISQVSGTSIRIRT